MDDTAALVSTAPRPTSARPLLGVTVLLVEDSRFASESMRLLCLRSGARLRRADCIAAAHRHLRMYCPTVAIIDLGLPDGAGEDLIAELAAAQPRLPVILGFSGDLSGEPCAIAAGADGFLAKPLTRLAEFQAAVLAHLPPESHPAGPRIVPDTEVSPDLIALQDDFAHVNDLLSDPDDPIQRAYSAQFLHGLAIASQDVPLAEAARSLADRGDRSSLSLVRALLADRLANRVAI
ncbi:putative response regulator [Dinoroseobacter shibae DFL 12 = DSM 16493]|jgi:CheY-like chemotaxis protein|uniref:Putative response regulator n=1 Tax=Dinoroseobacter shibae (strain DSM 16493 / NCIMB 14021 / DFL 12) TaxID=398580 RepID=A8LI30_DINSH|nr:MULTISPECIES: response regulator [Dinoroseobacter]ABV94364.1 putative response regulator [Dinoroseobacter shibae DFL 12 = DSM 16493]MDD9717672.1 response regulator [Dinoroseobacter sp. PD6]URF45794.1 response regulator [Dinoroseobacter shibae]URF50100.1 response regulator [Dinoroseobacter shibae]